MHWWIDLPHPAVNSCRKLPLAGFSTLTTSCLVYTEIGNAAELVPGRSELIHP